MAIDIEHDLYEGLLTMDDFDDCIIGVVKGIDNENKVCYSYHKVVVKLMAEDGMTEEDAMEHFYYNMMGCLLYTSPSPRDGLLSRMPSSA